MGGPSNRSHTGGHALQALMKAMQTGGTTPKGIADKLYQNGFIIVPHPYKQPAGRGGARAQIARANKEARRDA